MKHYKLTFAIPVFNGCKFINEAVDSAVAQNLSSYEIVIVNDGSSDDTAKVCKSIRHKYLHVPITYYEHKKNLGPSEAHNRCLKLSKGEFIYNLDADNILPNGLLVRLLTVAQNSFRKTGKHLMVSPQYAQFFEDSLVSIFGLRLPIKYRVMRGRLYFDKLDYKYIMTHPRTPATGGNYLYHRSIYEKTGGYPSDGGCFDNWGFGIASYIAGYRYILVPGAYYLHRLHENSNWMIFARRGLQKKYLYKLLYHYIKYYSDDTIQKLNPDNPSYPDNPYSHIILRNIPNHK